MPLTVDRLLEPFSFSEFHDAYYEKQPLLIQRRSPVHYADLLTLDALNAHLGEASLSSTAIRLVRDGEELPSKTFTYPSSSPNSVAMRGAVNKDLLFARFYDGYTIVIREYERHSAAMLRLRHDIERALHAPVLTSVYLTPRNSQGFTPHWDTHDTFILQFAGTKEWTIYDSPVTLPPKRSLMRDDEWTRVEPTLTATLEPGDLLYLPRGFVHEARSGAVVSGHITIGVHTNTYADLLRLIADNADVDPWLRQSLPIQFQSVTANDDFLRHVHQFFDRADLSAYVARMHSDFAGERLPDATDRLSDYVNLPAIGLTSRLRMRSVVCEELTNRDGEVVLTFNNRPLPFPTAAADSIRFMIERREFEVSTLPGDAEDNLALCRTLIREGFLSIVPSSN